MLRTARIGRRLYSTEIRKDLTSFMGTLNQKKQLLPTTSIFDYLFVPREVRESYTAEDEVKLQTELAHKLVDTRPIEHLLAFPNLEDSKDLIWKEQYVESYRNRDRPFNNPAPAELLHTSVAYHRFIHYQAFRAQTLWNRGHKANLMRETFGYPYPMYVVIDQFHRSETQYVKELVKIHGLCQRDEIKTHLLNTVPQMLWFFDSLWSYPDVQTKSKEIMTATRHNLGVPQPAEDTDEFVLAGLPPRQRRHSTY